MSYINRKLLSNDRNYSSMEKEALAIQWALDKLRYHLLGREVTLVTDHAPLKWMAGTKDINARVTRWFILQEYRFQVDLRPGREHANADTLSHRDACLWAGRPRGEVVEGVYRPYTADGARGRPCRHTNW